MPNMVRYKEQKWKSKFPFRNILRPVVTRELNAIEKHVESKIITRVATRYPCVIRNKKITRGDIEKKKTY